METIGILRKHSYNFNGTPLRDSDRTCRAKAQFSEIYDKRVR